MINLTVDDHGSLSVICSSRDHDDVTTLLISQAKIDDPYHLVMIADDGTRTEIGYLEVGSISPKFLQKTGHILRVRGQEILSSHALKVIVNLPAD